MRIVGGEFRGRSLATPKSDDIRPTTDRTRESLFNILSHAYPQALDGTRVLDLFAGTGAVGLEALSRGARGDRMDHLAPLLSRLFPGHAALAVNNNAGAILLALRALAKGREVVISRGELVEIGGSFRIPDILAASGARLVEVGTTNRTRLADYEAAIGPKTGALLKVHTSNFAVVGFTEEAKVSDLAALARARLWPAAPAPADIKPAKMFAEHLRLNKDKGLGARIASAAVSIPGLMRKALDKDYKDNLY